jgi:catechol 2,3-dioxygenase-like lactoylglutathione lyase family enzyme
MQLWLTEYRVRRISVLGVVAISVLGCATQLSQPVMSTVALPIQAAHAVTLSVPDLEAAARWYKEKLGFREVQRKSYPEFKTSLVFLELRGFRVELIEDGNAKAAAPRPNPPGHTAWHGIAQFSFRTTDLAAVKAALLKNGVQIVWEFENAELAVKFLFIRDLNGNLIQFLQPTGA